MESNAATPRRSLHAAHSPAATRIFWLKSRSLILRRLVRNLASGEVFRRYRRTAAIPASARLLARDEHPVYTATDRREQDLELGKVHNLRIAAAAVNGIVLQPSE